MPIRIRCRDIIPDEWHPTEYKGLATFSAPYSTASYADRNPDHRSLCGSVHLLLGGREQGEERNR